MNVTIQAETYAECNDFLRLIYNGKEYSLPDFSSEFKAEDFSLDHLLPKCDIVYRGNKMTYDEYVNRQRSISTQLNFFTLSWETLDILRNKYLTELVNIINIV